MEMPRSYCDSEYETEYLIRKGEAEYGVFQEARRMKYGKCQA